MFDLSTRLKFIKLSRITHLRSNLSIYINNKKKYIKGKIRLFIVYIFKIKLIIDV